MLALVELLADALQDLRVVVRVLSSFRVVRGKGRWGWVGAFGALLGPEGTRAVRPGWVWMM